MWGIAVVGSLVVILLLQKQNYCQLLISLLLFQAPTFAFCLLPWLLITPPYNLARH
jgi:hypothetical protein